ncbi:putative penicillin-binding protein precursor [Pusillimonas sp. T7-7]|uniref:D-alanyl-D-alanine endopeptidase n=1 Tax=Pusillimonas sp. (strain T7-7) TaxID=1007105 RepID=UPI00020857FB|nr:D-alanyl-D-alanine endopeptidase [Pusillimonas sp. T7-7]AEC19750.1 putative penicillin-binding protein precursor [Pusillimonas sp. T7-7]
MSFTWNPPHSRYSLLTVTPMLLLAASLSLPAQASSSAAQQTASAQASTHQTRIVQRQNLQPVNYTHGEASRGQIRVGVRKPGQNDNDIVIHRPVQEANLAPLTNLATLRAEVAFVQDLDSLDVLYDKNGDEVRPIASISKLMTALVVAEAGLAMDEMLTISDADVDRLRYSRSRLPVGTELSRADMLHLALMSSENRAAHALGRYYPGGMPAFVRAMNDKARALGMRNTRFVEPTGLSSDNVSTSRDLVKLLRATTEHKLIHRYTTDDKYKVTVGRGRQLVYNNTNRLVGNSKWDIKVSKTGFINEAGECLVMLTRIDQRDVAIVLLNSTNHSRIGDAVRLRTLLVENENKLAML